MKYDSNEFKLTKQDGSEKQINAEVDYFAKGNVVIQCNTPLSTEERSQFIGDMLKGGDLDVRDVEFYEQRPDVSEGYKFAQFSFKQDGSGEVVEEKPFAASREAGATQEHIDQRRDTLGKEELNYFAGQQWAVDNSIDTSQEMRESGRQEFDHSPEL